MHSPVERLVHWAHTKPDAPALLGQGVATSYAGLLRGVEARAAWLHQAGVQAGDTVALGLSYTESDYPQQVALFYAIAYLGGTILPLYPEVPLERRAPLADQMGAQWLLSSPTPSSGRVRLLDPATYAAQAAQSSAFPVPRGDQATQAFFFEFTSGTTGNPKAMCPTGREYAAMRMKAAQVYGWQSDDVMMAAVRWPSKVGVRALARALYLGASFLDMHFPETRRELAALVADARLTYLDCSPWQLRRLLASTPLPENALVPLRLLSAIGAAITPHEISAARQTLVANFHVGYGTTEIGLMGHLGPQDPADAPLRMMEGMEGQALDTRGQPLPAGQVGQLRFRASWAPMAYAHAHNSTEESFHDGWFVSSDVGAINAQGRITLLGRADDGINCGGTKIQPQEVEQVLVTHPDVADAAVVGVPDAMAGEIAVAFLVLRRPIALDAMLAFLAPRLEPYQVPAAIAGLEKIPRNPEGKILRDHLRSAYAAMVQKAPSPS